jgi:hypothetical protein
MTPEFWTDEKKAIASKVFVNRSEALEQTMIAPFRAYFRTVEHEVLTNLEASAKKIHGTYAGWSRPKILAHLVINKDWRSISTRARRRRD